MKVLFFKKKIPQISQENSCKYFQKIRKSKYLQLRDFIRSNQNNALTRPTYSPLEKPLIKDSKRKGIISELYNFLTLSSSENSQKRLNAWKEDLQTEVSEEQWEKACAGVQTKSINARLKLIHYKWLMRMYVTPVELNGYNKNIPDTCTKCMESKGTLFHCLWQCRKIRMFWEEVRVTIERIISKQITLNPKLFFFGSISRKT